jgi:hypothetical protein
LSADTHTHTHTKHHPPWTPTHTPTLAGVMLIDHSDELAALHERAHTQEATIAAGTLSLGMQDEEVSRSRSSGHMAVGVVWVAGRSASKDGRGPVGGWGCQAGGVCGEQVVCVTPTPLGLPALLPAAAALHADARAGRKEGGGFTVA